MGPASQMLVLYDGDCGFCRFSIGLLLAWDRRRRLRPVGIQSDEGGRLLSDLSHEDRLATAHAVAADATLHSGGAAAAPILRQLPGGRPLARVAEASPGAANCAYRTVAARRGALGKLVPGAAARWANRLIDERAP